MKTTESPIIDARQCGFCYPREHGKNGEVKREYSQEWGCMMSLCRKHSFDGIALVKEDTE